MRSFENLADVIATGVQGAVGDYLVDVLVGSQLSNYGFKTGDVVLLIDRVSRLFPAILGGTLSGLYAEAYTATVCRV